MALDTNAVIARDNSFHRIDPVNLQEGDEVELRILPDPEIKKLKGAFRIRDPRIIDEIVDSDIFE